MKHDFKVGDKVRIGKAQHANFSDLNKTAMHKYSGLAAYVMHKYPDYVLLDVDKMYFYWHPDCLSKISDWNKIEI